MFNAGTLFSFISGEEEVSLAPDYEVVSSSHSSTTSPSSEIPVVEPATSMLQSDAPTELVSIELLLDVGEIYANAKSPAKFTKIIQSLSAAQKYRLLTHHKKPARNHTFPTQFLGGCNRSFRYDWLVENPWLVYSEHADGMFCIVCAIFCNDSSKGYLVSKPFRIWNKKSEKTKEHVSLLYHQKCMELADNFKHTVENPDATITAQYDAHRAANIKHNRSILKSLASAVLFCTRQYIALRGDSENLDTAGNLGNFLALLKLLANHDAILRDHLEAPAMRNATYISLQTQNDLIDVLGEQIFAGIVGDINASPLYSVLCDEVTSHNQEYLSVCIRFIDQRKEIREEFLAFLPLERITGEAISQVVLKFLRDSGIPSSNMRGQGYDGASNMSLVL